MHTADWVDGFNNVHHESMMAQTLKYFVASLNQVGSHESSFVHQVKLVSVGWGKNAAGSRNF